MKFARTVLSLLAAATLTPMLSAAEVVGSSAFTNELFRVDTQTGSSTLIGAYKTVGPNEFGIPVLARTPAGALLGISSSNLVSRVYQFDEQNGKATPIFNLTFSPVTPAAVAIDPTDNSLWFSNTFGFVPWNTVERVDLGSGQHTPNGNIAPAGEQYSSFAFTPDGQLYTLNLSQTALWKVDKNQPANSTIVGSGLGASIDLSQGGSLTYDSATGTMIGYSFKQQSFFGIDLQTGLGTPVGVATVQPALSDIAANACSGSVLPYGPACVGEGGFVPKLAIDGCPVEGQQVVLTLKDAPGPSTALFFFGATQASIPVGNCTFLVSPLLITVTVPLGGSGPGTGGLTLPGLLPLGTAGASFTLQVWVQDPTSPVQWNGTNGLEVTVGA